MADRDIYVDAAAGGGGDGQIGTPFNTWATMLSGIGSCAAYANTNVWIKGTFTVGNNADTLRFNMTGVTGQDATHVVFIRPWAGFEGTGAFDTAPKLQTAGPAGGTHLDINVSDISILGIDCNNTATLTNRHGVRLSAARTVFSGYIRCPSMAINFSTDGTRAYNVLAKVTATDGKCLDIPTSINSVNATNVTCVSTGSSTSTACAVTGTGDGVLKNVAVYGFVTAEFSDTAGTGFNGSTKCAGQIASASQPGSITAISYIQITSDPFVASGSSNYFPTSGGQLDGAGTTTYTATDLAGATWDSPAAIGALEAQAAGDPQRNNSTAHRPSVAAISSHSW